MNWMVVSKDAEELFSATIFCMIFLVRSNPLNWVPCITIKSLTLYCFMSCKAFRRLCSGVIVNKFRLVLIDDTGMEVSLALGPPPRELEAIFPNLADCSRWGVDNKDFWIKSW